MSVIHGKVVFGIDRGEGVIEKYHARLIGLVGFRPYKGTLNVRVDKNIDIKSHSIKTISHVLSDGSTHVDAYLAPLRISAKKAKQRRVLKGVELEGDETVSTYMWKNRDAFSLRKKGKFVTWGVIETEEERAIIAELKGLENVPKMSKDEKTRPAHDAECWAIQLASAPREKDMIEIISSHKLTDVFDITDGTEIEIEFLK